MRILNLGCGTKASSSPDVVNVDWSLYLRIKRSRLLTCLAWPFLSELRRERLMALPENVLVHDLSKGIPFPDGSADVVYHSHLLEHLDRDIAIEFMREVKRVLKPGGIVRVVVPDLERACREYLDHVSLSEGDPVEAAQHDRYIAPIIEQSVRREGAGATEQTPVRRALDRLVLGDARQRGETHQWMYDRVNLGALLAQVGFRNPTTVDYQTSQIPGWNDFALDRDHEGREYKPESLYMEAEKTGA